MVLKEIKMLNIILNEELIKVLHLEGLEEKYPHQISAGEAQRVSLARSLMSNQIYFYLMNLFQMLMRV